MLHSDDLCSQLLYQGSWPGLYQPVSIDWVSQKQLQLLAPQCLQSTLVHPTTFQCHLLKPGLEGDSPYPVQIFRENLTIPMKHNWKAWIILHQIFFRNFLSGFLSRTVNSAVWQGWRGRGLLQLQLESSVGQPRDQMSYFDLMPQWHFCLSSTEAVTSDPVLAVC